MENKPTDNKEEQSLLHKLSLGQREGYEGVMNKYGPLVMGLVCRMVSEPLDAEELVQDTFVRAFTHIHDYQPQKASLKTWLLHIAYNVTINHLRKYRPESVHIEQWMEDNCTAMEDRLDAPHNRRISLLEDAIDLLSAQERTLLTLYYYDNLSMQEISQILGVKASTLTLRLFRIRHKLHDMIQQRY